jgi:hypothetical protein
MGTQLKRQFDGSYRGTYKGHEFIVHKEDHVRDAGTAYATTETHWVARSACGRFEGRSYIKPVTRDAAVRFLTDVIDRDLVQVPELDALLERWAKEIERYVPGLDDHDGMAGFRLSQLRCTLESTGALLRVQAVRFEEELQRLRHHLRQPAQLTAAPAAAPTA